MQRLVTGRRSARYILNFAAPILMVGVSLFSADLAFALKPVAGVNYDDPNMAVTNDFVTDSVTTCPANLKGKALSNCLERTGLKNADVAQAHVLVDDDAPPLARQRRTDSAR